MQASEALATAEREVRNAEFELGKIDQEAQRCRALCQSLQAAAQALDEKKEAIEKDLVPKHEDAGHAEQLAGLCREHVDALRAVLEDKRVIAASEAAAEQLERAKALRWSDEQIGELQKAHDDLYPKADRARSHLPEAEKNARVALARLEDAKGGDPRARREKRLQLEQLESTLEAARAQKREADAKLSEVQSKIDTLKAELERTASASVEGDGHTRDDVGPSAASGGEPSGWSRPEAGTASGAEARETEPDGPSSTGAGPGDSR